MSAPRWICALLLAAAAAASDRLDVPEQGHPSDVPSPLSSLLQAAGFDSSCVNSVIASCALDGNMQTPFFQLVHQWFQEMRETMSELKSAAQESVRSRQRPRHCRDLLDSGDADSGIRQVYPSLKYPDASATVFCEQAVDGGGWTVFQRRRNLTQREDFYRTWVEYRLGFGRMEGEFWLGLDLLHELTSTALQELRVDLRDYEGQHRFAKYGKFYVGPLDKYYSISVGRYSGNAGNGLGDGRHDGYSFSTNDSDHDGHSSNCAQTYRGGWWYDKCHISNLNGYQHVGHHDSYADGINWQPWKGYHYSLQETTMMIRPAF